MFHGGCVKFYTTCLKLLHNSLTVYTPTYPLMIKHTVLLFTSRSRFVFVGAIVASLKNFFLFCFVFLFFVYLPLTLLRDRTIINNQTIATFLYSFYDLISYWIPMLFLGHITLHCSYYQVFFFFFFFFF